MQGFRGDAEVRATCCRCARQGCRGAHQGCRGAQHCCRGDVEGSMVAEGMPSCKAAWLPRGCRGAQPGCEGPARRAAWLPRCCRKKTSHGCLGDAEVQGMAADRGAMSRCKAARLPRELIKIHDFHFLWKMGEPRAKWACQHLYI